MKLKKLLSTLFIIALCLSIAALTGCKRESREKLLARGQISNAADGCEDLEGQARLNCYKEIAVHCFRENAFARAALYFSKAQEHESAVNSYLLGKLPADAEKYCNALTGEARKKCALVLAKSFYAAGNYKKSLTYYQLAEKPAFIRAINEKIPAFQLLDELEKQIANCKDKELKAALWKTKSTLKSYIYNTDEYRNRPGGQNHDEDVRAAAFQARSLELIDKNYGPLFMKRLTEHSAAADWKLAALTDLEFTRLKVDHLITLMDTLDKIARQRRILSRHIDTGDNSNYAAAFRKALENTAMFFKTLEASEMKKDGRSTDEYINDLGVDMEIIEYISQMLDNIKSRIRSIEGRGKRIVTQSEDSVERKTKPILADFVIICENVLEKVAKADYDVANTELLTGYQQARQAQTTLAQSLGIKEDESETQEQM